MADDRTHADGPRILVVEDNFLIAEVVCSRLRQFGCETVGPVGFVDKAVALASEAPLEGALLDINLHGELCFPVAATLRERGVPFVFLTGYSEESLIPPELRDAPRLAKPVDDQALRAALGGFGAAGGV